MMKKFAATTLMALGLMAAMVPSISIAQATSDGLSVEQVYILNSLQLAQSASDKAKGRVSESAARNYAMIEEAALGYLRLYQEGKITLKKATEFLEAQKSVEQMVDTEEAARFVR